MSDWLESYTFFSNEVYFLNLKCVFSSVFLSYLCTRRLSDLEMGGGKGEYFVILAKILGFNQERGFEGQTWARLWCFCTIFSILSFCLDVR